MQLVALGKWSKTDKRWNLVVALRRPAQTPSGSSPSRAEGRKTSRQKLSKHPER